MRIDRWIRCLVTLGVVAVPACKKDPDKAGFNRGGSPPNLLLITVDTLRADRLGCYGYAAAKTPTMDALAGRGIRFARAYANAPLTLPSHATLLTGLLPMATGLHVNGSGAGGGALPDDLPTLATLLQARGYRTGAFVSAAVLNMRYGLNRGFDTYEDRLPVLGTLSGEAATLLERRGDKTRELVQSWLGTLEGKPFFAWVHFFDPHHPYEAPAPYGDQSAHPYDGEVAFVDAQIATLLGHLEHLKLDRNTIVVLVGDHGEGLSEHEEREHGLFVYNSTLHVPFILALPEAAGAGQVVETPVGLVDVMPTLLALLGLAGPDVLDGRNLTPAWRGEGLGAEPVYAESEYPQWAFGWAPLYALVTHRWKYIDAPQPEMFDLSVDPTELQNVYAEHPQIAAEMQSVISAIRTRKTHRTAAPAPVDEEARRQLAALGYAGSSSAPTEAPARTDLRNPKEMLVVYYALMDGMYRLQKGDFVGAVEKLELLTSEPQAVTGFSDSALDATLANLGDAYLGAQRFVDAENAFRASLRSAPADGRCLTGLAIAQRSQGRLDSALETLNKAAEVAPNYADVQRELASIFSHVGDMPRAIEHWRKFGELAPTSVHAQTNLGSALIAAGKPAEALGPLLRALSLDPDNEFIYRSLWQALAATGKRAEAIALLRDALRRFPDKQPFVCPLARLLSVTPGLTPSDRAEGLRLAQRCAGMDMMNPRLLDTLAAALAANGDFKKAIGTAQVAKERAAAANNDPELREIENHLLLFRAGRPLIE